MLLFPCLSASIDRYLSGAKVRMEFLGGNCSHGLYRSVIISVFGGRFSVGALDVRFLGILVMPARVYSGSGLFQI